MAQSKMIVTAVLLTILMGTPSAIEASMKGPEDMARPSANINDELNRSDVLPPAPSAAAATLHGYVSLYQKIFANLKWSNCQFSPSCSHYAQEALDQYGALAGISMAGDRLIRCNRWAWGSGEYSALESGHLHDPVSDQLSWGDR